MVPIGQHWLRQLIGKGFSHFNRSKVAKSEERGKSSDLFVSVGLRSLHLKERIGISVHYFVEFEALNLGGTQAIDQLSYQ